MQEGVIDEHLENCNAPIRLPTRARPFDELWIDSGCKYAVQGSVLRTVSMTSQSQRVQVWDMAFIHHLPFQERIDVMS